MQVEAEAHENNAHSDEVDLAPEAKRNRTVESRLRQRFEQNATRCAAEEETFYGLPPKVRNLFKELRGISKLYDGSFYQSLWLIIYLRFCPYRRKKYLVQIFKFSIVLDWQDKVLNCSAVKAGQNLIISLPTGGGKTLLSEILILKQIVCRGKDVLFVLPYVSIVQEKVKDLIPLGLDLDFLVEEYAASKGRIPPIKRRRKRSVYVATIERAQTLANSLYENKRIDDLGLVVIDEIIHSQLHLIGEGAGRGSALEQLIVKLMFCSPACQLIGMSATLSNLDHLKVFMKADLFTHQFRPVF
ncbi:Helicase POLQ-like [Trichuris trichiura]|uniref:Helicase POLQ-like n=1 Tax=Trichuris trichiura TaxID=36087 RepID=A0A077ZJY7_TRITR|nr:Helicase POLQ-like [Trichuris trichiura]